VISIYVATVSSMFGTSAVYHRRNWRSRWTRRLQCAAHAMIFLLIASTATRAFVLATPSPYAVVCVVALWGLTLAAPRAACPTPPERCPITLADPTRHSPSSATTRFSGYVCAARRLPVGGDHAVSHLTASRLGTPPPVSRVLLAHWHRSKTINHPARGDIDIRGRGAKTVIDDAMRSRRRRPVGHHERSRQRHGLLATRQLLLALHARQVSTGIGWLRLGRLLRLTDLTTALVLTRHGTLLGGWNRRPGGSTPRG
jgi:hemolysin III-related protein